MEITALPDPVRAHLDGYRVEGGNRKTSSSADVFCLVHSTTPDLFLKTLLHPLPPVVEADLLAEKTAMDWLQGKLAVPRVLCYHRDPEREYLLVSRIGGVAGHHTAQPGRRMGRSLFCRVRPPTRPGPLGLFQTGT